MPRSRAPSLHSQAFQVEVDATFASVVGCAYYVDTLEVITGWADGGRAMHFLNSHGIRWVKWVNPHPHMPCSLRIQRPTREVLVQLPFLLGRFEAVRVDLAADLFFGGAEQAEAKAAALQAFLQAHLTQKYHGKRKMKVVENGAYWAGAWEGRNIAIYSDKASKVTGQPCTHIEMRFYSAKQVRKIGSASLAGFFDVDPLCLLQKQCRLSKLDTKMVERNLEATVSSTMKSWARPGKPHHRRTVNEINFQGRAAVTKKVRAIMARGLASGVDGDVPTDLFDAPAQVWLEGYRGLVGRSVAQVPFPSVPLFNSPGNAPPQ